MRYMWQSPLLRDAMKSRPLRPQPIEPFSEKGFYLDEFHGRTLGIAVSREDLSAPEALLEVLQELASNDTRAVVISTDAAALRRFEIEQDSFVRDTILRALKRLED